MVNAILEEIRRRHAYLDGGDLASLYFGGGTPSALPADRLELMVNGVREFFPLNGAEITLEANPDDITPETLKAWLNAGFNRLSIGLQSFNDDELVWMNRCHTGSEGIRAVKMAQDAGFDNLSIDLIYGSRFQDLNNWEKTLSTASSLGVTHLSSYNLTVEKKTRLGVLVGRGKEQQVDEELSRRQFLMMSEFLESAGFVHYEVSNFARPGKEAVHNSNYWKRHPYLGLGPSAHSFNGRSRQWNVSSNQLYIRQIAAREQHFTMEELSAQDLYNEYIMTRLRTRWGCDTAEMERLFGNNSVLYFKKNVGRYRELMRVEQGVYTLNLQGMLRADGIASDLFIV